MQNQRGAPEGKGGAKVLRRGSGREPSGDDGKSGSLGREGVGG